MLRVHTVNCPMLTRSEDTLLGEPSPAPAVIIITVPSSPDEPPIICQKILRTPPLQAVQLHAPSDSTPLAPFDCSLLSPLPTMSQDAPVSLFQQRLRDADLPLPGADHFAARRTLWWSPGPNEPSPTEANSSRRRLEALLAHPGALEDDDIWEAGVDRVWRGLVNGAKLKHRLPLALVVRPYPRLSHGSGLYRSSFLQIKILQAGWIREGTWPKGAIVPDSDDTIEGKMLELKQDSVISSTTTPGIITPGSAEDGHIPQTAHHTDDAKSAR